MRRGDPPKNFGHTSTSTCLTERVDLAAEPRTSPTSYERPPPFNIGSTTSTDLPTTVRAGIRNRYLHTVFFRRACGPTRHGRRPFHALPIRAPASSIFNSQDAAMTWRVLAGRNIFHCLESDHLRW